jgi:hypothetical protein
VVKADLLRGRRPRVPDEAGDLRIGEQPDPQYRTLPQPAPPNRPPVPQRPAWYLELAVIAFLLVAYDQIANLADLRVGGAVNRALTLLRLEQRLHIAVERPLDRAGAAHHLAGQVLALYYDLAHILVTVAVLVTVYLVAPQAYRRARFALVVINLGALVVFLALPIAPPRLLPGGGFSDVVANSGTWAAWETTSGVAQHANEYASMPSLHVAWALWVVLAVAATTRRRWVRGLAGTHLVLTIAVVLLTGNHYTLDAVAGAVLAGASWAAFRPTRTVGAADVIRIPEAQATRSR